MPSAAFRDPRFRRALLATIPRLNMDVYFGNDTEGLALARALEAVEIHEARKKLQALIRGRRGGQPPAYDDSTFRAALPEAIAKVRALKLKPTQGNVAQELGIGERVLRDYVRRAFPDATWRQLTT